MNIVPFERGEEIEGKKGRRRTVLLIVMMRFVARQKLDQGPLQLVVGFKILEVFINPRLEHVNYSVHRVEGGGCFINKKKKEERRYGANLSLVGITFVL